MQKGFLEAHRILEPPLCNGYRRGFLPGGKFNYAKRFFMKLIILEKKQMISEKKFV